MSSPASQHPSSVMNNSGSSESWGALLDKSLTKLTEGYEKSMTPKPKATTVSNQTPIEKVQPKIEVVHGVHPAPSVDKTTMAVETRNELSLGAKNALVQFIMKSGAALDNVDDYVVKFVLEVDGQKKKFSVRAE